jgi:hypothetical protein
LSTKKTPPNSLVILLGTRQLNERSNPAPAPAVPFASAYSTLLDPDIAHLLMTRSSSPDCAGAVQSTRAPGRLEVEPQPVYVPPPTTGSTRSGPRWSESEPKLPNPRPAQASPPLSKRGSSAWPAHRHTSPSQPPLQFAFLRPPSRFCGWSRNERMPMMICRRNSPFGNLSHMIWFK